MVHFAVLLFCSIITEMSHCCRSHAYVCLQTMENITFGLPKSSETKRLWIGHLSIIIC